MDRPKMVKPPKGDRDLVEGRGWQRGIRLMQETATEAGTWLGAQIQAVEYGG